MIVSIPNGTIKRAVRNQVPTASYDVSIPNGTIKRFVASNSGNPVVAFQFQMVRLKGTALVDEDGTK